MLDWPKWPKTRFGGTNLPQAFTAFKSLVIQTLFAKFSPLVATSILSAFSLLQSGPRRGGRLKFVENPGDIALALSAGVDFRGIKNATIHPPQHAVLLGARIGGTNLPQVS
jgi:hypothetical protein